MSDFEQEPEEYDVQDEVKELLARGREQGFLTYEEIHEALPEHALEGDKYDEMIALIVEMGIDVVESAQEDGGVIATDDEEEVPSAAALNEAEIGRTTDPVRMYMREMGAVDLLTREGEIAIAKRIEAGLNTVQQTLAEFPFAVSALLEEFAKIEAGEGRLSDLVNGYGDPYANKEEETLLEESGDDEDGETLISAGDDDEDGDSAAPLEETPNNQDALIEAKEKLIELAAIHKKLMTALNKGKSLDDKKKPENPRRNQRIHRRLLLPAKNHRPDGSAAERRRRRNPRHRTPPDAPRHRARRHAAQTLHPGISG